MKRGRKTERDDTNVLSDRVGYSSGLFVRTCITVKAGEIIALLCFIHDNAANACSLSNGNGPMLTSPIDDASLLVHEPDNIRASSGWAKDCCYFLIPMYVHIVH